MKPYFELYNYNSPSEDPDNPDFSNDVVLASLLDSTRSVFASLLHSTRSVFASLLDSTRSVVASRIDSTRSLVVSDLLDSTE